MGGSFEGIVSHKFPIVDSVTAVKYDKGHVVLLGIGGLTYYWRITQHKLLLNSHNMHDNGVVVQDTYRKHGGNQCLILLDTIVNTTVPLVFYEYILKTNLLQQT